MFHEEEVSGLDPAVAGFAKHFFGGGPYTWCMIKMEMSHAHMWLIVEAQQNGVKC